MAAPLVRQLVGFGAAGATGFVVDLGIYLLLSRAGLPPLAAKVCSTMVGMVATFSINRSFSFAGATRHRLLPAFGRYVVASALGALVNWASFAAALALGVPDIAAVVLATAVAMCVNFLSYRHFVFRDRAAAPPRE